MTDQRFKVIACRFLPSGIQYEICPENYGIHNFKTFWVTPRKLSTIHVTNNYIQERGTVTHSDEAVYTRIIADRIQHSSYYLAFIPNTGTAIKRFRVTFTTSDGRQKRLYVAYGPCLKKRELGVDRFRCHLMLIRCMPVTDSVRVSNVA